MRKLGANERSDYSYRLVVKDHVGVLSRITGYIRRNGWNIRRMRVEPLEQGGQTEIWMQLPLYAMEAEKLEQCMHDWNFIFEVGKEGGARQ